MKYQKKWRQAAAGLLAVALLVCAPGVRLEASADYQDELDDLSSKYAELEKKNQAIQAQIDKTKNEKDKKLAEKKNLDNQVNNTQQQINLLTERINLLNSTIEEKEQEIIDKQNDIDENYDLFKQRMRAMYMTDKSTTIGLLLGAESFSEFLTRSEMVSSIAEHDQELLDQLIQDKKDIEEAKKEIEASKADVEVSKASMDQKKQELSGMVKQTEAQIQDIALLEQEYLANQAQMQKEMAAVQAEIDKIYQSINSTGEYNGGVMGWPVPGYSKITSDYGWRFNNTDFHTGIDISGPNIYGKQTVAVADGTVAFVQTTYTPGRGYGKYIIVDHGGGITTLYGHNSAILVSVGQKVTRGQALTQIGSTGWSTGPHLHFEVRVNGKHVNPWTYLK
ncbi:murein hydrolase activator EnvC family protein [Merdimmobilis hominis]|uniref:murein hydrolase activator EnvC family protein n=1 Tax=Merdimmobilis hominis TaxID=2897707 RepID=UPI0006C79C5D|nr:M23 family metallopeptidase [Merdimmobilis hominis]